MTPITKQDFDDLLGIRSAVNEATITFENMDSFEQQPEIVQQLDDAYNLLSYAIGLATQSMSAS